MPVNKAQTKNDSDKVSSNQADKPTDKPSCLFQNHNRTIVPSQNPPEAGLNGKKVGTEQRVPELEIVVKCQDGSFLIDQRALIDQSAYFKELVDAGKTEIELTDIKAEVFKLAMSCCIARNFQAICCLTEMFNIIDMSVKYSMNKLCRRCLRGLMGAMNMYNWSQILDLCVRHSFHSKVQEIRDRIRDNWRMFWMWSHLNVELCYEAVSAIADYWEDSEKALLVFVNQWLSLKFSERKNYTDRLMQKIRYSLMSPRQLDDLPDDVLTDTDSYMNLVKEAERYHKLPIHLRVLERGEQSALRRCPVPILIACSHNGTNTRHIQGDEIHQFEWFRAHEMFIDTPNLRAVRQQYTTVTNNFLITCVFPQDKQATHLNWYVYDPRTKGWSDLGCPTRARQDFTLLHQGEYLYLVGGRFINNNTEHGQTIQYCQEIEQYHFRDNKWRVFCEMPTEVTPHTACVIQDELYVFGMHPSESGQPDNNKADLFSIELNTDNKTWKQRASFSHQNKSCMQRLNVVKMETEEVAWLIHEDFSVDFYSPSKDSWIGLQTDVKMPLERVDSLTDQVIFVTQDKMSVMFLDIKPDVAGKFKAESWEWNVADNTIWPFDCMKWEMNVENMEALVWRLGAALSMSGPFPCS